MKYWLLCLIIFISCNKGHEIKSEIESFLGSTVVMTKDIENKIEEFFPEKKYFLLIYLENKECMPCKLEKVDMLKHYKSDFDKFYTGIALIIQDGDKKDERREDVRFLLKEAGMDYPIIFDENDEFIKNNKAISNKLCRTFIVDKDKKVIWIGSPIQNEKSMTRYRRIMFLLNLFH